MSRLPSLLRKVLRRSARTMLRLGPRPLRALAARVPFSRYHALPGTLFQGQEQIKWRDVTLTVDPGEIHGYYPYFLGDYSTTEMDKLIELCGAGAVVADVGANMGLVSLALAQACPTSTLHAFEPDPQIVAHFRANLALNPSLRSRVHLVQAAASDTATPLPFHSSLGTENEGTGRVLVGSDISPAFQVPALRLDDYFRQLGTAPTLVKIDVEGHELAVLEGMTGLYESGNPKAILVEVHAFYFPPAERLPFKERIHQLLEASGYTLLHLEGERWPPAPPPAAWPDRLHLLAVRA